MSVSVQTAPAGGLSEAAEKATRPAESRLQALDFTKGALVLLMIVYHSINYFHNDYTWTQYLRFLPASFILISGFLISHIYLGRSSATAAQLFVRLTSRGSKLLVLFLLLNLPFLVAGILKGSSPDLVFSAWVDGLFLPQEGKSAAFHILLPISYLLLCGALLVFCYKKTGWVFYVLLFGTVAAVLAVQQFGNSNVVIDALLIGLLGCVAGLSPTAALNRMAVYRFVLTGATVAYYVLMPRLGSSRVAEIVGCFLPVMLIFAFGLQIAEKKLADVILLFGKYSLVAYIVQIGWLQIIRAFLRKLDVSWPVALGVGFVACLVLSAVSVYVLDALVKRVQVVQRLYRLVFA
jgi:hypothetical protein